MQKKNKGALNLAGLVLFLLALPFFFGMGGGAFAMAEVLPGQAAASFLPYTEKTESLSAKVFGTKDVEFSQTPAVTKGGRTLSVSAEEMQGSGIFPTSEAAITSLTAVQLCFPRTLTQKKHWGLILA